MHFDVDNSDVNVGSGYRSGEKFACLGDSRNESALFVCLFFSDVLVHI